MTWPSDGLLGAEGRIGWIIHSHTDHHLCSRAVPSNGGKKPRKACSALVICLCCPPRGAPIVLSSDEDPGAGHPDPPVQDGKLGLAQDDIEQEQSFMD